MAFRLSEMEQGMGSRVGNPYASWGEGVGNVGDLTCAPDANGVFRQWDTDPSGNIFMIPGSTCTPPTPIGTVFCLKDMQGVWRQWVQNPAGGIDLVPGSTCTPNPGPGPGPGGGNSGGSGGGYNAGLLAALGLGAAVLLVMGKRKGKRS